MPILDKQTERVLPWLVAVTFFMQMLDTTIVNTALPAIARSLSASPLQMQSVSISYVLTVALLIPASGWLTDRFGIRHVFLLAIVIFSLGSLACAASSTLTELVASRVVQGIGGAILTPVGRLCILRAYPKEKLVQVLSFISIPALVGPLIGPALGGLLVDYISWHWIFLINLPVSAVAVLGTLKFMPNLPPPEEPKRFDWSGFGLFGFSMVALTLGIQGIGELHLPLLWVGFLLGFGLIALSGYVWHGAHSANPLFSAGLFATRNFSIGIIGNVAARLGMSGMPFLVPLFLQVGLGLSPFKAGMSMVPMTLAAIVGKSLTRPLLTRLGYRTALSFNTGLLGVLIASFSFMAAFPTTVETRSVLFALFGLVNSIQFTIMNTLTLIDLPQKYASSGNSLLSVVMQMGMGVGVATAATILGLFSGTPDLQGPRLMHAFTYTFWSLGAMTFVSAFIFLWIRDTGVNGSNLQGPVRDEAR